MDSKTMRIVFMGTPHFAVESLRKLFENGYNIVAVVTTADKPSGRGLKIQESAVKQYAESVGLPVLQPEKLRSQEFLAQLKAINADLGIVIAFRMLPEVVWSMPKMGTINLHASLLPNYRGAAPINWAIINGEKITGVTTFFLNENIDCGAILLSSQTQIGDGENAGELHDRLMKIGGDTIIKSVDMIASGDFNRLAQNNISHEIKPAPKLFPETFRIRWSESGETIFNLVRGLSPHPAARGTIKNNVDDKELMMKIFECRYENQVVNTAAGTIISNGKDTLSVVCGDGLIHIYDLQIAGGKRMSTQDFLRGFSKISSYKFM